jgi:hypothetical protein
LNDSEQVMPGSDHDAPFSRWMARVKNTKSPASRASFFVKMAGHTFEIPYDTWWGCCYDFISLQHP